MLFENGEVYVRTSSITSHNGLRDYSYCSEPIRIITTLNNEIIYQYTPDSWKGRTYGDGPRVLPYAYRDNCWEKVTDLLAGDENCALDRFSGCKIFRKKPIEEYMNADDPNYGFSFDVLNIRQKREFWNYVGRENAVTLIAATKHNVIIEDNGKKVFLDERYTNASDWELF